MDAKTSEMARVEPVARSLVAASEVDWRFADFYLLRADAVLRPVYPRERWLEAREERARLPGLRQRLREAVLRGDWRGLHALAEQAGRVSEESSQEERMRELARAVHGRRHLAATPLALALAGLHAPGGADLAAELARHCRRLRELGRADAEWSAFYEARASAFEGRSLGPGGGALAAAALDAAELRARMLAAVEETDFRRLRRLAGEAAAASRGGVQPASDSEASEGGAACHGESALAQPFPERALAAARGLGLEPEELPLDAALARDAAAPERSALAASLELLRRHPHLSSGGGRYWPSHRGERLLVEGFAEEDPPEAGPLLEALGLPHRRGLSRFDVEDALLRRGPALCASLGFDLHEFALVCIPFDAYLRLAPKRGWGEQRIWTHFDGYRLRSGHELQAMVGGDVRWGGSGDLCGVGRSYGSERLVVRFALLRRERLAGG